MKRGPKTKPANLHLVNGNPSKKPAAALLASGLHPPVEVPPCPEDLLSDDAKAEWDRITKELFRLRVIAQVDMAAVAAYCAAWGDWAEAQRHLRKEGTDAYIFTTATGYQQQGVWLQIATKAAEQMKTWGALFGMNPSSRNGIQPSQGEAQLSLFNDESEGETEGQEQDPGEKYF